MGNKDVRIMVIEDEEVLLQVIIRKLTVSGFETISCTSASQAIDYLKNLTKMPDVIWLDYYLPDMNGIEFMHELKKRERWSTIPVIVVSNSASSEKKNAMLALGVKEYLLKAENRLEDIIQTIEKFVEKDGD